MVTLVSELLVTEGKNEKRSVILITIEKRNCMSFGSTRIWKLVKGMLRIKLLLWSLKKNVSSYFFIRQLDVRQLTGQSISKLALTTALQFA